MKNPQNIKPFEAGQPISAGSLEGLRAGVAKRLRGLIGRSSSYSQATAQSTQRIRERIEILNNTGSTILAYSIFAVKKSGTITYPWGPPVRTEAFDSQVGFNYVTNAEYAIADTAAYQCLHVGSHPCLIRYNANDGTPKIGHSIGPLLDGSVSIKKCGYVVIAEPDTENELVWIVKSNDQLIRVKIVEDIAATERGQVEVQGEELCGSSPGVEDPNLVASAEPFVIDEVLNLTGITLLADTFHYAKPILGIGLCIIGEYDPIFKVVSTNCFQPGATGDFTLKQLNPITDTYDTVPNVTLNITDTYYEFMLLPEETADAVIYLDECGKAKFKLIGTKGLKRSAKTDAGIDCFSSGNVTISKHTTSCTGASSCTVEACNGEDGEEGRRYLFTGETVTILFLERKWRIVAQPIATHAWAQLAADLCPGDAGGTINTGTFDPVGYCSGVVLAVVPSAFDNSRSGSSGKANDWVKLDIDIVNGAIKLYSVTVTHKCKIIVVPAGGCDGDEQDPDSGKFIKYGDCKISGHILTQTSQMYCGEESWTDQIQLYIRYYLDSAALGPSQQDHCNFQLLGYFNNMCSFGEPEDPGAGQDLGSTDFRTSTMYDMLDLVYDSGDASGDGSGDNCSENPTLKLKGRERTVLVCDDCDTLDPENPNGPGTQCTGWALIEWVSGDSAWGFYPGYSNGNCSCENCEIVMPTDPPAFGESIYRIVNCTCINPANDYTCCADADPPVTPVECALETLSTVPLHLSTAYYRISGPSTDSQGRKCVYLVPTGFITFGDCEDGNPEELICGNPCPDSGS